MGQLVSIIIPVYKVEKYLNQCIDSVLNQTYKNIEILLIDDGSPDRCPAICDEYASKDNRIKVIHKENGGLSEARNCGIRRTAGEYILFLDSDDYWEDANFLEDIFEKNNNNADIIIFGFKKYFERSNQFVDKKRMDVKDTSDKNILLKSLINTNCFKACAWDKAVKRKLIVDNNMNFPIGLYSEDIEWCSNLILHSQSVAIHNKNVYIYRQREGSITNSVGEKNIVDILGMIGKGVEESEIINNTLLKDIYLSYFAYEYAVLLGLIEANNNNINDELKKKVYEKKYLLKYRITKKVKLTYYTYRLFGIKLTSKILGRFITLKNK